MTPAGPCSGPGSSSWLLGDTPQLPLFQQGFGLCLPAGGLGPLNMGALGQALPLAKPPPVPGQALLAALPPGVQHVGKAWSLGGVLANHLEIVNVKDPQDLLNVTFNIIHSLGHVIAGIVHTRTFRRTSLLGRVWTMPAITWPRE